MKVDFYGVSPVQSARKVTDRIYFSFCGKRLEFLTIKPLDQELKHFLSRVVDGVCLCLSFNELTVESRLQNWRVQAGNFLVNDERLLQKAFADVEGDKLLRRLISRAFPWCKHSRWGCVCVLHRVWVLRG